MDRWRLVACDERDAQAYLTLTRPSLSRFGAVVEKHGIATVDAWEAALSVSTDPRRGLEQAEAIADELWLP